MCARAHALLERVNLVRKQRSTLRLTFDKSVRPRIIYPSCVPIIFIIARRETVGNLSSLTIKPHNYNDVTLGGYPHPSVRSSRLW